MRLPLLPIVLFGLVNALAMAPHAAGADVITTAAGVQTGEVVRVEREAVVIRLAFGDVPVPKSEIISLVVPEPATYAPAAQALHARKFREAIDGLKPIVDRVGGLEIGWIEEAVLQLGDAYVGANEFANAKRIFDGFRALYAESPRAVGLNVKYQRILVGQKKHAEARAALAAFVEPLLKMKSITEGQEIALSEALLLLGDCEHALGKPEEALDHYLAVMALFDVSAARTAEAQFKAARLFEELKKPDRARQTYVGLDGTVYAAEAQKRLAALGNPR